MLNELDRTFCTSINSFYIGKFPVKTGDYLAYCRSEGLPEPEQPTWGWQETAPVVNVSCLEAERYCDWLAQRTGLQVRLPLDLEWEYAARGGNARMRHAFAGSEQLERVGWYRANAQAMAQPTGQKQANELDIYDMSGNVWEWCHNHMGDHTFELNSASRSGAGLAQPSRGSIKATAKEATAKEATAEEATARGTSGRSILSASPSLPSTRGTEVAPSLSLRATASSASTKIFAIRGGSWKNSRWACQLNHRSYRQASTRGDHIGFRIAIGPMPLHLLEADRALV